MSTVEFPNPILGYQGSGLQVQPAAIGPFVQQVPGGVTGMDYFHDLDIDKVPETRLRPYMVVPVEPCTLQVNNHYNQNGIEWEMIFRITSDKGGGVVGTSVALDVKSNYPEISMSIPKFEVPTGGFGMLKTNILPADYQASFTLSYWDNGKTPAIDGWLMLEVSYSKEGGVGELTEAAFDSVPKVSVARVTLLPCPTPAPEAARIIGANYR